MSSSIYTLSGRDITQSGANTTNTSTTLSAGLTLGVTCMYLYEFYAVAYRDTSSTLPSCEHSDNPTLELSELLFDDEIFTVFFFST